MFNKISPQVLQEIEGIVGKKNIIIEKEQMEDYSHDEYALPSLRRYPEIVVKPGTSEEISEILKLAVKYKFPVVPRGGATGLCGGCVPLYGGLVLSFEKMNKIIEIDKENLMATLEAGVTLRDFQTALKENNFFFPPHPGEDSANIGGVISTNAGGARAVKYGVVRNFVRGLEFVLPSGEIVHLGGKLIKDSSGYNLLQLIIGSEGTLGIITKAILSFLPIPGASSTLIVPYDSMSEALKSVPALLCAGIIPLSVEFITAELINITKDFLHKSWPVNIGNLYLLIILEGEDMEEVEKISEKISEICLKHQALDVFVADSREKQEEILEIRSKVYEATKTTTIEALDVVLPRNQIEPHYIRVQEISREENMWLPTFGHAADGNLHTHVSKLDLEGNPIENWEERYYNVRKKIHSDAKLRGGKISGEHGIGIMKKEYMSLFIESPLLNIMKDIKKVFDPNNILNPGKILD